MDSFGIPLWLFGICAVCSLFVGIGIRRWIERRKIREEMEIKEKAKELRKQQKRHKKIARKAKKAAKNKKTTSPE